MTFHRQIYPKPGWEEAWEPPFLGAQRGGNFLLAFLGWPWPRLTEPRGFCHCWNCCGKFGLRRRGNWGVLIISPFLFEHQTSLDLISEILTQTTCFSDRGPALWGAQGILTSWRQWHWAAARSFQKPHRTGSHATRDCWNAAWFWTLDLQSSPPSPPPGTWFIVVQTQWLSSNFISFFRSKQGFYSSITSPKFVCSSLRTVRAMFVPWESLFSNYFHISTAFVSSSFSEVYKNADGGFASG